MMMENTTEQYALITGASQGLGKYLATELAARKINTILVSLPGQGIESLCKEIRNTYGVDSLAYESDLSVNGNVMKLARWVNENYSVYILINNVGIGGTSKITETDVEFFNQLLQLNVVATSVLTHQLLPNLNKQRQSYILNVSSIAAFSPIGYKTAYAASKAYIHSFSRGLYQELKDSNVMVSVVHPGPMPTNEEVILRINKQGILGKLFLQNPEKVAKTCVSRLLRKKPIIMVNPFSWLLLNILPICLKTPLLTKTAYREVMVGK